MDIFNVLTMIGGLCLFLFGMSVMGQALERRAGGKLQSLLSKITTGKLAGLTTGIVVTAIIQSSSATTVMVVGFVNSGLMTLKQAINVIMGANIGTTVTAWILSLTGIESGNVFVKLLKPSSFTPILALIGIIFYMFSKKPKCKDTGMILLGFATLMFGMETMSSAVSGLSDVPAFTKMFLLFKNPILGVLVGATLTAIIQSSSASVGILQAFAVTGQVSMGAAVPIIMGSSIGTCVTAMLSSVGANKEAKRASMSHLCFNIIGSGIWLIVFCGIEIIFNPAILNSPASMLGIAVANTTFKVFSTAILLPASGWLEKVVCRLVPDDKKQDTITELDERLFSAPPIALARCHEVTMDMIDCSVRALKNSLLCLDNYSSELAEKVREDEKKTDHYEDVLSTYLLKLSTLSIGASDSNEVVKILKVIEDFERISDYAINIVESAEELRDKEIIFSIPASKELSVIAQALEEIVDQSIYAFKNNDVQTAKQVEPLEQVIDSLKEKLRTHHILRMQQGLCGVDAGFIWSDLLTNIERVSDHCSNVAGCVIDINDGNLNLHESLQTLKKDNEEFTHLISKFAKKYDVLLQNKQ